MPLASQARSSKAKAKAVITSKDSYSQRTTPSSLIHKDSKARNANRKPVALVDTNLNSYDRTDPFFAFNTLIKLLGSLPSRIGGCQFKFTPDEHKLSLHLLSIVEPFVGLTASRRSMTRQPTEILDSIIFHIPSRRDLLSLALSCHRMYDVIFPRHFNYRHIRCRVSSISVWNHLVVHRSLAKNVRRLEILDERSTSEAEIVPPGILVSDTDLESTDDELALHDKQERYLVSALHKMTALSSFSWSCNHSPISIDNVWPTLLKCHSLNEVEINDNLVFSALADSSGGESASKSRRKPAILPGMTTISMRSTPHIYGSSKQPTLSRISNILNHCPNLQSLEITYKHPRASHAPHPLITAGGGGGGPALRPQADDLLLSGRWPNLTVLTLTNLRCAPAGGFDSAVGFLGAHSGLEVLHLDLGIGAGGGAGQAQGGHSRLALAPNTLPRLKELQANRDVMNAVLGCPCDTPRPLETLKGFRLSGHSTSNRTSSDLEFLTNLRNSSRSIKRIDLTGWNEMEDIRRVVECAPGLTWFDVGRKSGSSLTREYQGTVAGAGAATGTAFNTLEWAALLSSLPDLTTFHGIKFFYEVSPLAAQPGVTATNTNISMADRSRIRKNDEVAAVLAWKCPKLRRMDHWEAGSGEGGASGGGKVVVLVRDRDGSAGHGHGHGPGWPAGAEKEKARWEVRRVKV